MTRVMRGVGGPDGGDPRAALSHSWPPSAHANSRAFHTKLACLPARVRSEVRLRLSTLIYYQVRETRRHPTSFLLLIFFVRFCGCFSSSSFTLVRGGKERVNGVLWGMDLAG